MQSVDIQIVSALPVPIIHEILTNSRLVVMSIVSPEMQFMAQVDRANNWPIESIAARKGTEFTKSEPQPASVL